KLAIARQWVSRSVRNVQPIALEAIVSEEGGGDHRVARKIVRDMGGAAPLVRSFEFIPFQQEHQSRHSGPSEGIAPHAPPAPPAPAPPLPPKVIIDVREALAEVEAERQASRGITATEESIDAALKTLESIPLEMIIRQSTSAAEKGLSDAADENAVEREKEKAHERREELIEKGREVAEARQMLVERLESSRKGGERRVTPGIPVMQDGEVVGSVMANVHDEEILREIFLSTAAHGDEIPFAIDSSGKLYSRSEEDEELVRSLDVPDLVSDSSESSRFVQGDWIIATSRDAGSGLLIGVLRPAAEAISQVRKATFRSLGLGLALVAVCLIGVLPLANHMTRDVTAVTAGAERIAHGELETEVPVRSRNEVGRLAVAFNRMSSELRTNQKKLVEEEAARREQEVREQLLKEEYDRTASELEDARQFQLSMLPSSLPSRDDLEIAVEMTTATEVGGDYYDFHSDSRGLTVAIGDGTGHGAKAGTMVVVIKSLFTALRSTELATFLTEASATIRSMQLGRMSMALTLLRFENGNLRMAAAGMPPLLLLRHDGRIDELANPGLPLGTMEFPYEEKQVELEPGDIVIAMTDGLPEMLNDSGDPYGYEKVSAALREARPTTSSAVIGALQAAADQWRGDRPQSDDMTLLVMRYRG
ncbi:MAG: SpoIIE family protein phosphatase, partial [Acidobacteria bacterium]|nr:SpoIIE family protein phosphatase [Acidobacteriota bacterium]